MKLESIFVASPTVKVSLKNDALASRGDFTGQYVLSSTVNGKPSYKLGGKAIWYNTENYAWVVGLTGNIGSTRGVIFTKTEFGGLTDGDNRWNYFNEGWKVAGPNDIIVQSTCKYSMIQQREISE